MGGIKVELYRHQYDAVEKMRARYTDLTADERERVLKSDEMDNGLKELLRKAGIEYGY